MESFGGGSKSKRIAAFLVFIWVLSLGTTLPAVLFTHLMEIRPFTHLLEIRPILHQVCEQDGRYNETTTDDNGTSITREIFNQYCFPFPKELKPLYPQIIVLTRFVVQYVLPLVITRTLGNATWLYVCYLGLQPSTFCAGKLEPR